MRSRHRQRETAATFLIHGRGAGSVHGETWCRSKIARLSAIHIEKVLLPGPFKSPVDKRSEIGYFAL